MDDANKHSFENNPYAACTSFCIDPAGPLNVAMLPDAEEFFPYVKSGHTYHECRLQFRTSFIPLPILPETSWDTYERWIKEREKFRRGDLFEGHGPDGVPKARAKNRTKAKAK
jgi:hypothetical protein